MLSSSLHTNGLWKTITLCNYCFKQNIVLESKNGNCFSEMLPVVQLSQGWWFDPQLLLFLSKCRGDLGLNPKLLLRPGSLRPSVCECVCVGEGEANCKALWIKALYECSSLPFWYTCISTEDNQNVTMVLQAAIRSVPQPSPTLMKTP